MALLLQGPAPWSIVGSPHVRLEGRTPNSVQSIHAFVQCAERGGEAPTRADPLVDPLRDDHGRRVLCDATGQTHAGKSGSAPGSWASAMLIAPSRFLPWRACLR